MAAFKPEVPISKLVDKLGTKFQWQCICFRGPATQWIPCRRKHRGSRWNFVAIMSTNRDIRISGLEAAILNL